jgi:hypothetical protein
LTYWDQTDPLKLTHYQALTWRKGSGIL